MRHALAQFAELMLHRIKLIPAARMSCRNPRLPVRINPPKVAPTASTAIKTLISSTLMLPPNPFGPFSHAP